MTQRNIDFTKIRIHEKSQNNGFEELCVQLFRGEYGSVDSVKRVDGAGGDGGVEAYQCDDAGVQGMQAKYWCDRMGDSQWTQLKKSVNAALANHPTLHRYEVMVALDRTPKEIEKWDKQCETWKAKANELGIEHEVEFVWIGKSEIIELLLTEKYKQKKSYWFDLIDFDRLQLEKLNAGMISCLDLRYTPEHHVDTGTQEVVSAFFDYSEFLVHFKEVAEPVVLELRKLKESSEVKKCFTDNEELKEWAAGLLEIADRLVSMISKEDLEVSLSELNSFAEHFISAVYSAEREVSAADYEYRKEHKTPEYQGTPFYYVLRKLRSVRNTVSSLQSFLKKFLIVDYRFLLIRGEAGKGKSHLLAKQVETTMSQGGIISFLLGEQFHGGLSLEEQITALSGFSGSFNDFLSFLNEAAEAQGTRAFIVIDGVNESDDRRMWKKNIIRVAHRILDFQNIDLVISCREDFCEVCLPNDILGKGKWAKLMHKGFEDNLFEAVALYFKGYNVRSEHLPPLIPEFKNPLFLKTVCEAFENSELTVGEMTLKGIMERRVKVLSKKIEDAIDCSAAETEDCLLQLADQMKQSAGLAISVTQAQRVCKGVFSVPERSKSLYSHLRSNGMLVEIFDYQTQNEMVRFPYERFSNYFVTEQLLSGIDTPEEFIEWWKSYKKDLYEDWQGRQNNRGVLSIIAILAPDRFGLEFCDLLEKEESNRFELELFVESLVWRKSSCATSEKWMQAVLQYDVEYGSDLWLTAIIELGSIPNHPYNGKYLHEFLNNMSLPEREISWTIPINSIWGGEVYHQCDLKSLFDWADYNSPLLSDEQAELIGTVLLWLCSSTNRELRDQATKVASRVLKGRSQVVTELIKAFSTCDDPYVVERLYAVASAVATVERNRDNLKSLAEAVFEHVFSKDTVNPHILTRHSARTVIEIANYRGVQLDGAIVEGARPPYKSEFPDIISEEKHLEYGDDYKSPYSTIIHSLKPDVKCGYGDFGRYEMQYPVECFSDINIGVEATKKQLEGKYSALKSSRWIFQRILELGWTPKLFKPYEDSIRTGDRSPARVERISKKYQWIGLYEFCGYLSDHYRMAYNWHELPTYDRPAQLGRDGIDPCIAYCEQMSKSLDGHLIQKQYNEPFDNEETLGERKSWVEKSDLDSFLPLIKGGAYGDSILLSGTFEWKENLKFGKKVEDNGRLKMWAHMRSYLVRKDEKSLLLSQLRETHFYGNGICLESFSDVQFGEYPWSQSCDEIRSWCEGRASWLRNISCELVDTTCTYGTDEFSSIVPSPQLCDMLNLQWTGVGTEFGNSDELLFNSILTEDSLGPRLATLKSDSLSKVLKENDLDIVWCIVAERGCWDNSNHITGSESEYSYIIYFEDGELVEELVKHYIQEIPQRDSNRPPPPTLSSEPPIPVNIQATEPILESLESISSLDVLNVSVTMENTEE